MNHISLVTVLVKDHDRAIAFYRDQLGFTVAEDLPFGKQRWVTLRAAGDSTVSISLNVAEVDEDQKLVGRQDGSAPLLRLSTDDCMADYRRLKSASVKCHGKPKVEPYGTGLLVEDLYGNKIYINQEPECAPRRAE